MILKKQMRKIVPVIIGVSLAGSTTAPAFAASAAMDSEASAADNASAEAFLENTAVLSPAEKTGVSQAQVMALYDKYLAKYRVESAGDLFNFAEETYNADGSLSEASKQQALDVINFMRELAGLKTVGFKDEYNGYAQAGIRYLIDHNLNISHTAAANSGNEAANAGLSGSNLAQGSSNYNLYNLLLGFYGDDDNSNRLRLGHRAWMLNPTAEAFGIGIASGEKGKYLAIHVMGSENIFPEKSPGYASVAGAYPVEILREISESKSMPWTVATGTDSNIWAYMNSKQANRSVADLVKVTVTDNSDGQVYDMPFYTTQKDSETTDWFNYSGNSSNKNIQSFNINPHSIYAKYGYEGLAGKSFTITIVGQVDDDRNTETLTYPIEIFSLLTALENRGEGTTDEAVAAVTVKINAIGGVTLQSEAKINDARGAFEALTEAQRAAVAPALLKTLTDAEAQLKALKEASISDKTAAANFEVLAKDLPDKVTLENEGAVIGVRAAYEGLTEAQKARVGADALSRLTGAENAIAIFKGGEADKAEASKVNALIDAIPENIAPSDEAVITTARTAYNALSEKQKPLVVAEAIKKLTEAETRLAQIKLEDQSDQEAVQAVEGALSSIPDTVTLGDEATLKNAQSLYNALTEKQQGLVKAESLKKLTDAEKTLETLKQTQQALQKKADAAAAAIQALPATITLEEEQVLQKAQADYDALPEEAKPLVSAPVYQKLKDAQKTLENLKAEKEDRKTAQDLETAIAALPKAEALKLEDRDRVNQAQKQYNALADTQRKWLSPEAVTKLADLQNQFVSLEGKLAADQMNQLIKSIKAPKKLTLKDEGAVNTIAYNYNSMRSEDKALVDKAMVDKLNQSISRIAELKQAAGERKPGESVKPTPAVNGVSNIGKTQTTAIAEKTSTAAKAPGTGIEGTQTVGIFATILAMLGLSGTVIWRKKNQ